MADRTEMRNRRAATLGRMPPGLGARLAGGGRFTRALRIAPRLVLLAAIIWAFTGPIDRSPLVADAAGVSADAMLPAADMRAAPYFQETGYAVADGPIAAYFVARGGVRTFGPPVSNLFPLLGVNIQIFRDHVLKMEPTGTVATVDLFAMGAIPFRNVGGRIIPDVDPSLASTAPPAGSPDYPSHVQSFIRAHAPDAWEGMPVGFHQAFLNTVPYADAFPNGGDRALLPGFAHEVWGVPLSRPVRDAQNPDVVLQRWERGVMVWSRQSGAVTAVPLGETFKAVLTGQGLGPERTAAAASSPFLLQFNPGAPAGVARPGELPNTLLANAFTQGTVAVNAAQVSYATATPYATPYVPQTVHPSPPLPSLATTVPGVAPAGAGVADLCYGDEVMTYSPELPHAGNELLIAVTSKGPHPYGRLAGTEKTTFIRERLGQLGYVWEWTVQLTYPGEHEYTFYVDSTIPCKKLELEVRDALATKMPTPYGLDNGNSNNNGNNNDSNNNDVAPYVDPAAYIMNPPSDAYNCAVFLSQAQAQSVLRYSSSDPNRLDAEDGVEDGIACTSHSYSSYPDDDDWNPVPRVFSTATLMPATATIPPTTTIAPAAAIPPAATVGPTRTTDYLNQGDKYGCNDFLSQAQAQAVLRADSSDPNKLDISSPSSPTMPDGIACNATWDAPEWAQMFSYPAPYDKTPVPR